MKTKKVNHAMEIKLELRREAKQSVQDLIKKHGLEAVRYWVNQEQKMSKLKAEAKALRKELEVLESQIQG